MSKKINFKFALLSILFLIFLNIPDVVSGNEPEAPEVILTVQENIGKLVVVQLPFIHVGEIPNLGAAKINLVDNGATMGTDYSMSGVGIAHNIKTGEGIAVLEFVIIDDAQGESAEEFIIILDLGTEMIGGSVRIVDNDSI